MLRDKIQELLTWKAAQHRKPLVLKGARQVGKTWLLQSFAKQYYQQLVYINFEEQKNLQNLFIADFNIPRIIKALEITAQIDINAADTLIIFDEIQTAENGITSLKYFYENAPQYHLIAAGSMLGIAHYKGSSFPVGKVEFLELMPLSFLEFLQAVGQGRLADSIKIFDWSILNSFHSLLMDQLRTYMYVGGMPEAINTYLETNDFQKVRKVQQNLLNAYQSDFAKYAPIDIAPKLNMVWQSMPAQLAKVNKKFIFNVIKEGARAKEFEVAIQWLLDSGLLLKTNRIKVPKLPMAAYEEAAVYKLFLVDVGLLGAMAMLPPQTIIDGDRIFQEFKGAIAEQYVCQQLATEVNPIGYWTNDKSTAEVDFLVQMEDIIIAIEVKSGENVRSKSFSEFYKKYQTKAIRYSALPYQQNDWMQNIPLYAIGQFGANPFLK
jgi:uncharacterized protein